MPRSTLFATAVSVLLVLAPSVAPAATVVKIAAGAAHTCTVMSDGVLKCWGANRSGQLGDGTTTDRPTPVVVGGFDHNVVTIAAGARHTCAATSAGAVKCWGDNSYAALGNGTSGGVKATPVDVVGLSEGVVALAAGDFHTCALMNTGGVKCWGHRWYGQLGDGVTPDSSHPDLIYGLVPGDVTGLTNGVKAIAAGASHTCALMSTATVKCWGVGWYFGNGASTIDPALIRRTPVDVPGVAGIVSIAAGGDRTFAVTAGGGVKKWIGWGGQSSYGAPSDIPELPSGVTAVTAGYWHQCVITDTGAAKCWGVNINGQVGDGTLMPPCGGTPQCERSSPVDVVGLTNGVTLLAAGGDHSVAVLSGGRVAWWGATIPSYTLDVPSRPAYATPVGVNNVGARLFSVVPSSANGPRGVPLTWTAMADGSAGLAPLEYRFYRSDSPGNWTMVQDYGPSTSYTWANPTPGSYIVEVWVRSAGSTALYEDYADGPAVAVSSAPPVSNVTVIPSVAAAPPGSSVTWTVTGQGGLAPYEYRFFVKNLDGGDWVTVQPYSTSNTWTMANATAGHYLVEVWARSAGSAQAYEGYNDAVVVTVGTPAANSVAVTPNVVTTTDGKSVTWTAMAGVGTGPGEYRFWRRSASGLWTMAQDYSASNSYTWTNAAAGSYVVEVWARSTGSTTGYELYADAVAVTVLPTPTVRAVTVTSNVVTALPGAPLTWSVTGTGGVGPLEYRFFVRDLAAGTDWVTVQPYSSASTWTMASAPPGRYLVEVWARSAGSPRPYEAYNDAPVVTVETPPITLRSITGNVTTTLEGASVTWTAFATGGQEPLEYRFWRRSADGPPWTLVQDYSPSNSYTWTSTVAGSYVVEVWVRSAGSGKPYEAYNDAPVVIVLGR